MGKTSLRPGKEINLIFASRMAGISAPRVLFYISIKLRSDCKFSYGQFESYSTGKVERECLQFVCCVWIQNIILQCICFLQTSG